MKLQWLQRLFGLLRRRKAPKGLVEFFRQSPLVEVNLDLERDPSLPREVEL